MTRHTTVALALGSLILTGLGGIGPARPTYAAATALSADADPAEEFEGWLDDDENAVHRIWVRAGNRIVVRGTCDRDCTDLDLALRNPRGAEVASDRAGDDRPYIGHTAATSGMYVIEAEMFTCDREPCHYEVAVAR